MLTCKTKPYEGNEPYIFLGYSKSDEAVVCNIIDLMSNKGYRIWYDNGIRLGEDASEVIAARLYGCAVCMFMITESFATHRACRNELTTAIDLGKSLLPVILDNFQMSPGLSLQLSSVPKIVRSSYPNEREFFESLYSSEVLGICRESHGSAKSDFKENRFAENSELQKQHIGIEMKAKIVIAEAQKDEDSAKLKKDNKKFIDMSGFPAKDGEEKTTAGDGVDSSTNIVPAVLIRLSDQKIIAVKKSTTYIGTVPDKCDIFMDSKGLINAKLSLINERYYLNDCGTVGGIFVNGNKLNENIPTDINDKAEINFGQNKCILCLGNSAEIIFKNQFVLILECLETNETMIVLDFPFSLGRHFSWPGGTFSDKHTSRYYGSIILEKTKIAFICSETIPVNGIRLNDKDIKPCETILLNDDDEFKMGIRYTVKIHIATL